MTSISHADPAGQEPEPEMNLQFLHDIGIELINGATWQAVLSDPRWCNQPAYLHWEKDRLDGEIDLEGVYFSEEDADRAASNSPQWRSPYTWKIFTAATTLCHLANNARAHTLLAHHIRKALADDPAAQPVTVGVTKRNTAYLSHDKARVVLFEGSVHFCIYDTEAFVTRTDPPLAGLLNEQGQIVIPAQFENIYSFDEEFAVAKLNSFYGVINRDGAWVIEPSFLYLGSFFDGICTAQAEQGWGVINREGEWVIPPRYHDSIHFRDGLAKVAVQQEAIKLYGLINQSGQEIIPVRYRQLESSGSEWNRWEPVLVCDDAGKWGAFTTSGDLMIPCIHDSEETLRELLSESSKADEEDAEESDDTETESEMTDSGGVAQGLKLLTAGAGILFLCVVAGYFREQLSQYFGTATMFLLLFGVGLYGIILFVRGVGLSVFKNEDTGVIMAILGIVLGVAYMAIISLW